MKPAWLRYWRRWRWSALMLLACASMAKAEIAWPPSLPTEVMPAPLCGMRVEARHDIAAAAPKRIDPERMARFDAMIATVANQHRVPMPLVRAVVAVESAYDPQARSVKGASGLMQLMPDTAKRFGVSDRQDPVDNLHGGVRYLRWLMDRYDSDLPLVLAAYNAGEGSVARYDNRIPPYPETRHYVAQVMAVLQEQCHAPATAMPTMTVTGLAATTLTAEAIVPSAANSGTPTAAPVQGKTVADVLHIGAAILRTLLPVPLPR